jgi:hypothetical protein
LLRLRIRVADIVGYYEWRFVRRQWLRGKKPSWRDAPASRESARKHVACAQRDAADEVQILCSSGAPYLRE